MRNLAKGFFSMVLVVALLLGGMVGASASEKVEITIGGLDYVYMPMVVEAFNAANPDIHLTYMPDVGNVDDGTLQAVLQSGLGPDIIGTGSGAGRIGPLAKNGLIQPINAIYDEYKLWDRYQPFVVDALKKTVNDGNIYEVLEGLDVFQIYYNIEIFEKSASSRQRPGTSLRRYATSCWPPATRRLPTVSGADWPPDGWLGSSSRLTQAPMR